MKGDFEDLVTDGDDHWATNEQINDACNFYFSNGYCPEGFYDSGYFSLGGAEVCPCTDSIREAKVISSTPVPTSATPTPKIIPSPKMTLTPTKQIDQSAKEWYNKAKSYAEDDDFEKALNAINEAIKVNPNYKEAWGEKGYYLIELKRYSEALTASNKAIDLGVSKAYVWNNKGIALKNLGRYEEALEAYQKAISVDPEDAKAWYNKGIILMELKRYEEALDAYDTALSLDPEYAQAYSNKGNVLLKLKKYQDALDAYDRALSLDPEYVDAWNNKGNVLWKLKKYQGAYDSLYKALQLDPSYTLAKDNLEKLLSEHSSEINQNIPIDNTPTQSPTKQTIQQSSLNIGKATGIDLSVTDFNLIFKPRTREIAIDVTIKNSGYKQAGKFNLKYILSENQASTLLMDMENHEYILGGDDVVSLDAGTEISSSNVKVLYLPTNIIPPGEYWFAVFVDSGNSIEESDETNNIRYWNEPIEVI